MYRLKVVWFLVIRRIAAHLGLPTFILLIKPTRAWNVNPRRLNFATYGTPNGQTLFHEGIRH